MTDSSETIGIEPEAEFPFVRRFDLTEDHGLDFSLWITNDDANRWFRFNGMNYGGETYELLRLTDPGERILEFGTHHASYAVPLAMRVGDEGVLVGVEAHPESVEVARKQVELNKLESRLKMIHAAGDANGGGAIYIQSTHCSRVKADQASKGIKVPTISGDKLDERYGPFTMLKVDVEGFEEQVLSGCKKILERRPKLALEIHLNHLELYGSSLDAILELIHVGEYEGTMIMRPDFRTVHTFSLENFPAEGDVNVFLTPKG